MWCARIYGCPDLAWTLYLIVLPLILIAFIVHHLRHRLWRRALATVVALLGWAAYFIYAILHMVAHQCKVNCSGVEYILPGVAGGAVVVGWLARDWLRTRRTRAAAMRSTQRTPS